MKNTILFSGVLINALKIRLQGCGEQHSKKSFLLKDKNCANIKKNLKKVLPLMSEFFPVLDHSRICLKNVNGQVGFLKI
jgi:ABC-type uncharacterized transport system auxiliary subunit